MAPPLRPETKTKLVYFALGFAAALVLSVVLIALPLAPSGSSASSSQPSVVGHSAAVSNATTVTTPEFNVVSGSLILLFVSWVNVEAGGGMPSAIGDSLGDSYHEIASTNFIYNHTEALYAANMTSSASTDAAYVSFAGGQAPAGGSVASVDISHASLSSIEASAVQFGEGPTATVAVNATHSGSLFVLGVAGRGVSGPFTAGTSETLLDTGTGVGGPFEDGVGYGTFVISSTSSALVLSANLNTPTWWIAVGVSVVLSTS